MLSTKTSYAGSGDNKSYNSPIDILRASISADSLLSDYARIGDITPKMGGDPNIIPPPKNRLPFGGSADTVHLGLYVSWLPTAWRILPGLLDAAKLAAQENSLERFLPLMGSSWEVAGHGRRSGGGFGPVFTWQLKGEGLGLSIARQQFPKGDMPNVLVSFGSLYLMTCGGLLGAYNYIKSFVEYMGGVLEKEVVSRVDCAVDIAGVDVQVCMNHLVSGRRVQWATSQNIYMEHGKVTGLQIGKGDIVLRLYDKIAETQRNPEKRDYLINERWGGELPDKALRVEFQIRRDALKEFGITTVADYCRNVRGVLKYLTEKWFRLTDDIPVVGHVQDAISSPLWRFVSHLFDWCFSEHEFQTIHRVRKTKIDTELLKRQGIGCLLSVVAASRPFSAVNASNIEGVLVGLIRSRLGTGSELFARYSEKRLCYETRFPNVA
jgi:hypothetical protein